MKPAPFSLDQPATLAEAQLALQDPQARIIAGGQSLGAMLNLRLAQPSRLVAIGPLPELAGVSQTEADITLGACVTHAAIADGRTPDLPGAILARIAQNIAYRAVRNRGTIGGSICHADPAADWLTVLMALGASVIIAGPATRAVPLTDFVTGAFRVALAPGEIVRALRIPRPQAGTVWGYSKACRKPGEFAHAMAAVQITGAHTRLVFGATGGKPILLINPTRDAADSALQESGLDSVTRHMQLVTWRRAQNQAEQEAPA